MKSRALRRHYVEQVKERVKREFWWIRNLIRPDGSYRSLTIIVPDRKRIPRCIGFYATTPANCSCYMCRNKRRDEGPRVSELKRIARVEPEGE